MNKIEFVKQIVRLLLALLLLAGCGPAPPEPTATPTPTPAYTPTPVPPGRIAFFWSVGGAILGLERPHSGGCIRIMNADGTNESECLTRRSAYNPSWSPDGKRIAFAMQRFVDEAEAPYVYGIYTINADGTGETQLVGDSDKFLWSPDWSPDGEKIAFIAYRYKGGHLGGGVIMVMNADGSELKVVHDDRSLSACSLAWSPDGEKIAFSADPPGSQHDGIYVMNPDGTGVELLATASIDCSYPGFGWNQPAWSPDGKRIAFAAWVAPDYFHEQIYVMNADGTEVTQLTHFPEFPDHYDRSPTFPEAGYYPEFPESFGVGSPTWSPDGNYIAFCECTRIYPGKRIWIIRPDGSGLTAIRKRNPNNRYCDPSWSH